MSINLPFLAQISRDDAYANTLGLLRQVIANEFKHFQLTLLSAYNLPAEQFQVTGFCNADFCPAYSASEMLQPTDNFPILQGAFISQWRQDPAPRIINCEQCPELFQQELKYFGEAIVVPIWLQGKVEHWVVIVDFGELKDDIDLEKLSLLCNYTLSNILRAEQKRQLDQARQWIDNEIKEISRLQSLLLPQQEVSIPGIDVAFRFKAFKDAGGDYLDIFNLRGEEEPANVYRWGCMIADVTGHGPAAAVEAAMLDAILRAFRTTIREHRGNDVITPADAANFVNKNFFTRRDRGKFITANFFSYQSLRGSIRYVSAGHPYAYVKRGSQLLVLDQSQGIPIGVKPDYHYEYGEFVVEKGDVLFIYTDVVLETRNSKGQEYGAQRLEALLKQLEPCPHRIIDAVEDALLDWGNRALKDDLTLCAIKILG
jgi:serine phosphatase RsbU (regulator of sigma subunit)